MPKKTTVTILFTSDIHGHILPHRYGRNEQADLGLAKYATVVKEYQKRGSVLIIDNGDLLQGTPLMTHYVNAHSEKKNPIIEVMNAIGLDCAVVGNHEFNFGKKVLTKAIKESVFPWLSANILDKATGAPLFGKPYIIKKCETGLKIAVVGVTTHFIPKWENPNHIEGIEFIDAYATLKGLVEHIRAVEKPDILIASYHGGFERDIETGEPLEPLTGENQAFQMCTEIDGIDVLLTGHQHRQIIGKLNGVLVVQPGSNGEMYSEITIDMATHGQGWRLIDKQAQLCTLEGVRADINSLSIVNAFERSTQKWLDEPIGYIIGDMTITDPHQARMKKHPFIQFIQDVQKDASGVDISVSSLLNNETAGFGTVVTMRDVVFNYMFPNTLVVLELTGKDIKAALEKSATYFTLDEDGAIVVDPSYIYPKAQHYNYDMWEGIYYEINVANNPSNRIVRLDYKGSPLKMKQSYKVVLNNYRASGGGNYDMFINKPIVKEIQQDTVQLIEAYFQKQRTVQAYAMENFYIVNNK
ncbi:bifunctional metallophosphatase/5'-nucleotidase [Virgibacillus sp. W0430]|uniref:bifunctional metallophosphatase/5'-nucleotidase n=1 Tax=Virgibacillus sp. W0430 TaxID=3391580 RepID=UPI003F45C1F6